MMNRANRFLGDLCLGFVSVCAVLNVGVHAFAQTGAIYAGTNSSGVFKSIDGGASWSAANNGLSALNVNVIAVDPTNPTTLYATTGSGGVFKSTDGGASWSAANRGLATVNVGALAIDPTTSTTLYAATSYVNKSTDGGAGWSRPCNGFQPQPVLSLAVDSVHPTTLYAGDTTGAFKSSDGGANWSQINTGIIYNKVIRVLAIDPTNPATLYAATEGGVYRSSNAGASWSLINTGLTNMRVEALVIDLTNPTTLYVGTAFDSNTLGGVFKSTDGGATWRAVSSWNAGGTSNFRNDVWAMAIDPTTTPTLYVGAGPSGGPGYVWKTTDGGLNWSTGSSWTDRFSSLAVAPPFPQPRVNPGGTVNGASFAAGAPVSPGSIVSVFGTGLAADAVLAGIVPLPTALGSARVLVNGTAAPLFYVSPMQTNSQVPWELAGQSQASLTVIVGGVVSSPATINLATFSPGIFTLGPSGQGAVLIASSGEVVAPRGQIPGRTSRPANRGEYISIYCTGLGPVTNQPPSGRAASSSPLSATTTTPMVTIGGVPVSITGGFFAGLAPEFVGLYQVNVQVPQNAPTGDSVPLQLSIGGSNSNTVTIAVQ